MVTFTDGRPDRQAYRRFRIRTITQSNDFAMMREAVSRHFGRLLREERRLPDLLMVDGGKGQLGVAVEVLQAFDLLDRVPVCGLAKQFEEIYLPGRLRPVILPRRSEGLFLMQRVRDEAHRFAITSHRARRRKMGLASQLEGVPGIGPARRKALLKAFDRDIEAIRTASVEQLAAVPGITRDIAENIKAVLGG